MYIFKGSVNKRQRLSVKQRKNNDTNNKENRCIFFSPYCNDAKEKRLLMNHQTSIFGWTSHGSSAWVHKNVQVICRKIIITSKTNKQKKKKRKKRKKRKIEQWSHIRSPVGVGEGGWVTGSTRECPSCQRQADNKFSISEITSCLKCLISVPEVRTSNARILPLTLKAFIRD